MPELPEVEVLCRHLAPKVHGQRIVGVQVFRPRVLGSLTPSRFRAALRGARIGSLHRRAKYLCFTLRRKRRRFPLVRHLGMTGRMYCLPPGSSLPPHTAVVLRFRRQQVVFEDAWQFGRMTLNGAALAKLGAEPFDVGFTSALLRTQLDRSAQPIKVRLLNQAVIAGLGNIYASEALFRAGIDPRRRTSSLAKDEIHRLHRAIRFVLGDAIRRGSTMPLDFAGQEERNGTARTRSLPATWTASC